MQWISLAAAAVLLDAAVTFRNVWPTPAVWWSSAVSIELAACVLVAAIFRRYLARYASALCAALGATWTLLAIGRYAEVTSPALWGRDINLYWDLRFLPDVAAMMTAVAPPWLVAAVAACAVAALALTSALFFVAWKRIGDALLANAAERRVLVRRD